MLLKAFDGIDFAYCPEEILNFLTVGSERDVSYVYGHGAVIPFSLTFASTSGFIRQLI